MGMYYYDLKKKLFCIYRFSYFSMLSLLLYLPLIMLCLLNKKFIEAFICISLLFLLLYIANCIYDITYVYISYLPSHYLKPDYGTNEFNSWS